MKTIIMLLSFGTILFLEVMIFTSSAFAAACTANCSGGGSVTCTGHTCVAQNGTGCQGMNEQGKVTNTGSCSQN